MAKVIVDDGFMNFEVEINPDFDKNNMLVKVKYVEDNKEDVFEGEIPRKKDLS